MDGVKTEDAAEVAMQKEETAATVAPAVEVKREEDKPDTKDLFSASSPPPPPSLHASTSRSGSRTRSPTPDGKASSGRKAKNESAASPAPGPILIDDLPTAWDEAHETFETLEKCVYERKDLGASREADEMMVCDCTFDRRESIVPALDLSGR